MSSTPTKRKPRRVWTAGDKHSLFISIIASKGTIDWKKVALPPGRSMEACRQTVGHASGAVEAEHMGIKRSKKGLRRSWKKDNKWAAIMNRKHEAGEQKGRVADYEEDGVEVLKEEKKEESDDSDGEWVKPKKEKVKAEKPIKFEDVGSKTKKKLKVEKRREDEDVQELYFLRSVKIKSGS